MRKINHLYWRAGFGLSPTEWEAKHNWSVEEAVADLFNHSMPTELVQESKIPEDFKSLPKSEKKDIQKLEQKGLQKQFLEWMNRMAQPDEDALLERMCLFWHGHFACRLRLGSLAANYLNAIRKNALGNFRDLVLDIARDPGMIRYLNNQQNRKQKPNENFARELLELFTIGRGNYTEVDIKEAARAFTGWSSTFDGQYIFRPFFHDYGNKTFFGKTGKFNGEDIINLILEDKTTATFIVRKIYRYFVNDRPNESIIAELANSFYTSDYDIGQLMRKIFISDWFYDQSNIGTKIKSPVELIAGIQKSLNVTFQEPKVLIGLLRNLGQIPFNPPNVAGWPGGKDWVDNSTLMLRLNIPAAIINKREVGYRPKTDPKAARRGKRLGKFAALVDFNPIESTFQAYSEDQKAAEIQNWLLLHPSQLKANELNQVAAKLPNLNSTQALTLLTMSTPEYQMC